MYLFWFCCCVLTPRRPILCVGRFKKQTLIGKWKGLERATPAGGSNGSHGSGDGVGHTEGDNNDQQLIFSGDVLVFDRGQKCWNGPARSLRVALACGPEDVLSAVTEPETCTYTAVLETPAACSPALREALIASSRVVRGDDEQVLGGVRRGADAGVEGEL